MLPTFLLTSAYLDKGTEIWRENMDRQAFALIMGLNIPLFSGYPLLPFPLLLTPLPPKKTQIAERSTVRVLILIDYDIASGPLSTICTCRPVNYTCNLG